MTEELTPVCSADYANKHGLHESVENLRDCVLLHDSSPWPNARYFSEGLLTLRRRPRKAEFFHRARRKEKIGRRRIEHTARSIFSLQRGHLGKGGFAAGGLVLTGPKARARHRNNGLPVQACGALPGLWAVCTYRFYSRRSEMRPWAAECPAGFSSNRPR